MLPAQLRPRVHFFNSFLFTQLTDRHASSVSAAYEHVRRWTRGVNLFEKDWLILPINDPERHHWSLLIIAHPGRQVHVAKAEQHRKRLQLQHTAAAKGGGRGRARGTGAVGVGRSGAASKGRDGGGLALHQMTLASDGSLLPSSPSPAQWSAPPGRLSRLYRQRPPPPPSCAPTVWQLRSTGSSTPSPASASPPLTRQRSAASSSSSPLSSPEQETSRRMSQSKLNIQQEEEQRNAQPAPPPPSSRPSETQLLARYGKERREQRSAFDAIQRQLGGSSEALAILHQRSSAAEQSSAPAALRPPPPPSPPRLRSLRYTSNSTSTTTCAPSASADQPLAAADWDREADGDISDTVRGARGIAEEEEEEAEANADGADSASPLSSPPAARPGADGSDGVIDGVEGGGDVGRYPVILHFDSLPFPKPQAARIASVLRQYLQCEWNHQLEVRTSSAGSDRSACSPSSPVAAAAAGSAPPSSAPSDVLSFAVPLSCSRVFDARTLPHVEVQVPGQPNDYDCGPFILEYAHRFCSAPFSDTRPHRVHRPLWFEQGDVHKRTEMRSLLQRLKQEETEIERAKADSLTRATAGDPQLNGGSARGRPHSAQPTYDRPSITSTSLTAAATPTSAGPTLRGALSPAASTSTSSSSSAAVKLQPFTGSVPDSDGEEEEGREERVEEAAAEDAGEGRGGRRMRRSGRLSTPSLPLSRSNSSAFIPSSLGEVELGFSESDYIVD